MKTQLQLLRSDLTQALATVDSLLNEPEKGNKGKQATTVDVMIDYCLRKEKDTTFNADFAEKMRVALTKYPKLTERQLAGLVQHHALALRWDK